MSARVSMIRDQFPEERIGAERVGGHSGMTGQQVRFGQRPGKGKLQQSTTDGRPQRLYNAHARPFGARHQPPFLCTYLAASNRPTGLDNVES
jgi:hypothetical protein